MMMTIAMPSYTANFVNNTPRRGINAFHTHATNRNTSHQHTEVTQHPTTEVKPPTPLTSNNKQAGLVTSPATIAGLMLTEGVLLAGAGVWWMHNHTPPPHAIETPITTATNATNAVVQYVERTAIDYLPHLNITPFERTLADIMNVQLSMGYHVRATEGPSFMAANNTLAIKRALRHYDNVFLPDTHGNAMKAVMDAFVTEALETTPENLGKLSQIYQSATKLLNDNKGKVKTEAVAKALLNLQTEFSVALQRCTRGSRFTEANKFFIQGGDTLTDVAMTDSFALAYSNWMHELGGSHYISLNSNHDMTALYDLVKQVNPNAGLDATLKGSPKKKSFERAFNVMELANNNNTTELVAQYKQHLSNLDLIRVCNKTQPGHDGRIPDTIAYFTHASGSRKIFEEILTHLRNSGDQTRYQQALQAIAPTNETIFTDAHKFEQAATVVNQWHRETIADALRSVDDTTLQISSKTNASLKLIDAFTKEYEELDNPQALAAVFNQETGYSDQAMPLLNPKEVKRCVYNFHGHQSLQGDDRYDNRHQADDVRVLMDSGNENPNHAKTQYKRDGLNNYNSGEYNLTQAGIGAF